MYLPRIGNWPQLHQLTDTLHIVKGIMNFRYSQRV